ncbi:hypothetical protein P885DRAFT_79246 [Corynascus similis CBS 632.67]
MHCNTVVLGLIATAGSVFAAPAQDHRSGVVSARDEVPEWTITSFTRTCNEDDTSCDVSFGIDTHLAPVTDCFYTVTGTPASQAPANGITCGDYTISSGWDPNGFTTWSVVDYNNNLIVWPGYNDNDLVNGQAVTPDKSYPPSPIP